MKARSALGQASLHKALSSDHSALLETKGRSTSFGFELAKRVSIFAFFLFTIPTALLAKPEPATFDVVSWNLQTFGSVPLERRRICKAAYDKVISTSVYVVAFQEVANTTGINTFQILIPPRPVGWATSFEDTSDSQDNGILYRVGKTTITSEGFLFQSAPGPDTSFALHPIRNAHLRVGNFDFTLVSLHLTFRSGNSDESKRELLNVLDWLDTYLNDSANDPDVIIAGDFNLPSAKGVARSLRSKDSGWWTIESIIGEHGGFTGKKALSVLIDEPTSRTKKRPANNYDHFIVTQGVKKALVKAGRVSTILIDRADNKTKSQVSDHYPVYIRLKTRGTGIQPDL